jgi:hypothetical protein
VSTKEVQQAQDVVLGLFFTSSHRTIVLFDSGASHSFILSAFVANYHRPMSIMKHNMLVSSSGGDMRTKHICPAISITIRGVDFLANLIILDSMGIDMILGLDWLKKYDGVILCAKRAVKLATGHDTTVEFSVVMTSDKASMLNQVQGNSLEQIRVVHEYHYVFPEELPCMLTDSDIEFIIDLLPGTSPLFPKGPIRSP